MMPLATTLRRYVALSATIILAGACQGDRLQSVGAVSAPPRLSLESTTDNAAAPRVLLRFHEAGAAVPGSFRVAVHYDTTRFRFVSIEQVDSPLIVAHDTGGRVMIAGASLDGFAAGPWTTLRFEARDGGRAVAAAADSPFTLQLLEVGDRDGTNLRSQILVDPRMEWRP